MIYFPLTILQELSQLGRSTTTDIIEHISEEKSLLKIIAKIFLISLTSSLTSYQGDSTVASYGVQRRCSAVVVAFNNNFSSLICSIMSVVVDLPT